MEILRPIEIAVAWIMVQIHSLLTGVVGMADGPGAAWVLSIVGLTVVIRILIIPLFFKQIKASRGMQLMQPVHGPIRGKAFHASAFRGC